MRHTILFLALIWTMLWMPVAALATPISLEFSGAIIDSSDPLLPDIGETFDGILVYDDATPDQDASAGAGYYDIISVDVVYSGGLTVSSTFGGITIADESTDQWAVVVIDETNPNLYFGLVLADPTGETLTSDALVTPQLGSYPDVSGGLIDYQISAFADHTIWMLVPEPSTASLLIMGLAMLATRAQLEG